MKADSVLPEPVGAAIRVWRPALIAGQAPAWAAVGARNVFANQAATAGWNSARKSPLGPGRALCRRAPSRGGLSLLARMSSVTGESEVGDIRLQSSS